jgi:MFS family permease
MDELSGAALVSRRHSRRSATSPGQVLAIVCVGIVLANLDLFIVNVGLPNIAREFKDATLEDLSWILNGYAIVYAALLVFFGRLAERCSPPHRPPARPPTVWECSSRSACCKRQGRH